MLLICRSMDLPLWKTSIYSLCSIDNPSFPIISISSLLLQLPISSSISQIVKEQCSSFSSYSFDFCHLSFSGIMKEATSSQNMTNPIGISMQDIIQKCLLLSYTSKNLFISYFLCPFYLLHSPLASHQKALQIQTLQNFIVSASSALQHLAGILTSVSSINIQFK